MVPRFKLPLISMYPFSDLFSLPKYYFAKLTYAYALNKITFVHKNVSKKVYMKMLDNFYLGTMGGLLGRSLLHYSRLIYITT